MLQTIKSTAVIGTLLVVGYGVHIVLNKPPSDNDPIWNNAQEFMPPSIDFGGGDDASATGGAPGGTTLPNPLNESNASQPIGPSVSSEVTPSVPDTFPTPYGGGYPSTGTPDFSPVPNFPAESNAPNSDMSSSDAGVNNQPPLGQTPPMDPSGEIAATSHIEAAFDDMWASAQNKLQTGDLIGALLNLSILYGDESLQDIQRDQLITLLDQLAGTVIYSPQHTISPAYIVQTGDTLESIATRLQVPAAFLSRVNGIPLQSPVQQGQSLKVVTGPFRAELSLSRREMTLFLGRYYAGRFNVGIGRDLPAQVSTLEVCEKSGPRPYFDARTRQSIAPGTPDSPYGQFWIGLRSGGEVDPMLGIHDTGPSFQASDTRGCITVSSRDADDLQAILAVGSRIDVVR